MLHSRQRSTKSERASRRFSVKPPLKAVKSLIKKNRHRLARLKNLGPMVGMALAYVEPRLDAFVRSFSNLPLAALDVWPSVPVWIVDTDYKNYAVLFSCVDVYAMHVGKFGTVDPA